MKFSHTHDITKYSMRVGDGRHLRFRKNSHNVTQN